MILDIMRLVKKYYIGLFILLIYSSCASQTFEWIKVNPDKINLAKASAPYHRNIKEVQLTFQLKEKPKFIYYENPDEYLSASGSTGNASSIREKHKRPISSYKPQPYQPGSRPEDELHSSLDELNNAIINPMRKEQEVTPIPHSQSRVSISKNENLSDQRHLEKKNSDLKEETSLKNLRKAQKYIWVGFVMGVLGVIMGFIFRKSAFIIAIIGIILAAIGLFAKV